ncbi:hypothetical protein FHU10_4793 [Serratia fonticola]|uniref:Uncharacterized protein n=1 Tax=Serratia fonticola TaxID=47917 RepID=A0A542BP67_SERFO|nr:DUF6156 family protein [Serratia fonticola]TQI80345.1 hypothetical protein FHU09_2912 [Serratia fonticola]TQI97629.1 hypothetical protein FHU11_3133 [Serratia fonticola]TVZ72127.1 hypothetical protein FHU10_4793 [Serratia fonticola]
MNNNDKYRKVDDITVLRILPVTHFFSENWELYGHSWIELGKNESYGWWPAWPTGCPILKGMLLGVPGDLNGQHLLGGTPTKDPHHRDRSRGVVIFDLYSNDERTSDEIKKEIRNYVGTHKGKWQWPLGLCCHSFQKKMLKDLSLTTKRHSPPIIPGAFNKQRARQYRSTEKTKYYASFTEFRHPVRLLDEVTDAQALTMNSYIKASFNADNKLITIERFVDNLLYFKYEYLYADKNKIIKVYLTKEDGGTITINP